MPGFLGSWGLEVGGELGSWTLGSFQPGVLADLPSPFPPVP